jgi:uncharacterized protein related to proFAR isomerase
MPNIEIDNLVKSQLPRKVKQNPVLNLDADYLINNYDALIRAEEKENRSISKIIDSRKRGTPERKRFQELGQVKSSIIDVLSGGTDPFNLNRTFNSQENIFYDIFVQMSIYKSHKRAQAIRENNIVEFRRLEQLREKEEKARTKELERQAQERRTSQKIQNRIFREDKNLTNMEKQDKLKAELKTIKRIEQIKETEKPIISIEEKETEKLIIPALTVSTALIIAGGAYLLLRKKKK